MIIEAPISMRSNTRIRRFINKTLIPQIMFWGIKDGENDKEINEYISKEIGKNIQEQIKTVSSGKFDEWDIEDLV